MFDLIVHFISVYVLGSYLITTLQWYNYKLKRVIFHFHKYLWHLLYFVVPIATYIAAYKFFWIYLFFGLIPALFLWYKRVKNLTITKRVKRFFTLLGFIETINLVFMNKLHYNPGIALLIVILLTIFISDLVEYLMFIKYKNIAKKRLQKISPKIVVITASYGKTSIKNFLYQLLQSKKAYKTPRSVNTLKGIVLDINTSLPENTQIYIAEAGAREKGDIKEIVEFLENEYAISGKVGAQHIEYFKTLDNIKKTKLEVFLSKNLKKGFSYELVYNDKVEVIKDKIKNIKASLDGVEWTLEIKNKDYRFFAPILGEFNAINISLAIFMAITLGETIEDIQKRVSKLEPIPHRLQKIEVGGKIIIDDSFNGNLEGMISSYELIKEYPGRKIIITPGIVETTEDQNIKLAKKIDEIFDIVIITGKINKKILGENIIKAEKIFLNNKTKLEKILSDITTSGDLILFSNDTPDYL